MDMKLSLTEPVSQVPQGEGTWFGIVETSTRLWGDVFECYTLGPHIRGERAANWVE